MSSAFITLLPSIHPSLSSYGYAAFQVADLSKTEETLGKLGIEFHKLESPYLNYGQMPQQPTLQC